jgi:YHS domain-containing protein
MFRALLELIITILVAMVARALISSVLKGFGNASSQAFREQPPQQQPNTGASRAAPQTGRELHKDPVCGTYVADSTAFRRQVGGITFYYCSDACRARHALAAK